jgi:hypothetical protein
MATSKVDIVNRALRKIKSATIETLTENTAEGRAAAAIYEESRQFLLKRGLWTWAIARQKLAQLTETPVFEYDYAYRLPADSIRIVGVYSDTSGRSRIRDYRLEGVGLVCNYSDVYLRYIKNEEDPNKFGPDFRAALEDYMAYQLALVLPGSKSLADGHLERFERISLPRAMSSEAIDDGEYEWADSEWITERWSAGGGGW